MQKKIIALAIAAAAAAPAFAQSNVQIYGIVDAYVATWSGNGERVNAITSSGLSTSRLGFKGTEDLGGGLKAVFNIEGKLTPDAGTFGGGDRQLNVGLSGGFGTVLLGTMSTLSDGWHSGFDPVGNLSGRVLMADVNGNIANAKPTAIAYVSPNFSGFTLAAANIFGEQATSAARENTLQVGGRYDNGPLSAFYTFADKSEAAASGANAKQHDAAISYDFGVVKAFGTWEQVKNSGVSTDKNKLWQVGLIAPVSGAGAVHFAYAKRDNQTANADTTVTTLAYSHGFSKRTTGYVGYARLNNDSAANMVPHASFTVATDTSYSGFVAGLRHSF